MGNNHPEDHAAGNEYDSDLSSQVDKNYDLRGSFVSDRYMTAAADKKMPFTTRISGSLNERLRNAVVARSGPPHHLNISKATQEAIERYVEELESENDGKPYPPRSGDPRPGRPIKFDEQKEKPAG